MSFHNKILGLGTGASEGTVWRGHTERERDYVSTVSVVTLWNPDVDDTRCSICETAGQTQHTVTAANVSTHFIN